MQFLINISWLNSSIILQLDICTENYATSLTLRYKVILPLTC